MNENSSNNDLEELNFKEKEYNDVKLPQFEKEKEAFMLEHGKKTEYFNQLQRKCQNIERNNELLSSKLENLRKELFTKKDELLKNEDQLKEEFSKYSSYLN